MFQKVRWLKNKSVLKSKTYHLNDLMICHDTLFFRIEHNDLRDRRVIGPDGMELPTG